MLGSYFYKLRVINHAEKVTFGVVAGSYLEYAGDTTGYLLLHLVATYRQPNGAKISNSIIRIPELGWRI